VAAFSTAEESRPAGSPACRLRCEFTRAMGLLGGKPEGTLVYQDPGRRLSYHRQEGLEGLVPRRRRFQPQAGLVPRRAGAHQDPQVLHAESVRAFKDLTLWGYELPWNHISLSAQAFVVLDERHVESKWKALEAYESQLELERAYFSRDFIFGLAKIRGTQVRAAYAEAFEVLRVKW